MQNFCDSTQNRELLFYSCNFVLHNSVLRSCFWLTESKTFRFFAFFLWVASFSGEIMVHSTEKDLGTLDSGIAVHSYTGIQEWISRMLGLQSIAQTSTNKQMFRMIQAHQFFNEPGPNSSIIVPMAHETLKHQCNLQHGLTTFFQNWFVNSS